MQTSSPPKGSSPRGRLAPVADTGPRPIGRRVARSLWRAVFGGPPSATARRLGLAIYARKAERNGAYREWSERFGGLRLAGHYGHFTVDDEFASEHLKSQLYELTSTLRRRLSPLPPATRVLDAGASDGLFLEVLGIRRGVGLNIMPECARNVVKDGYAACVADLGALPFRPGAFDLVICCETLEHLPDPIQGLRELGRVCRGRICVSIPWIRRTRITGPAVEGHRPDRQHVFEFDRKDFMAVAALAGLRTVHHEVVRVFPGARNPAVELLFRETLYRGYFPRLQYFELAPLSDGDGRAVRA